MVRQINDQYAVRFPEGLRPEIKRVAKENGRSMNAEIVYRLKKSLEAEQVAA